MSSDREWARRAALLEFESLPSVRKSAESWRNGLGALAAIVIAAGFVKGQSEFQKLSDSGQKAVAVTFGLTVLCLVIGSLLGMSASFGTPSEIGNSGEALREWTEQEATRASTKLTLAKLLTAIGVVSLTAMIYVTWFDEADKPVSTVTVTRTNGDVICGDPSDSIDGVIVVTDASKAKVSIPIADIASLVFGACPKVS